jgi:hypothetical protein
VLHSRFRLGSSLHAPQAQPNAIAVSTLFLPVLPPIQNPPFIPTLSPGGSGYSPSPLRDAADHRIPAIVRYAFFFKHKYSFFPACAARLFIAVYSRSSSECGGAAADFWGKTRIALFLSAGGFLVRGEGFTRGSFVPSISACSAAHCSLAQRSGQLAGFWRFTIRYRFLFPRLHAGRRKRLRLFKRGQSSAVFRSTTPTSIA